MIITTLAALAAPWRAQEDVDLPIDPGRASVAVLGEWGGTPQVIVGGPQGIGIHRYGGAGTAVELPLPARDLALVDLDDDGRNELLVCGEQGLVALRGVAGDVRDIRLVDQPCDELAIGSAGTIPILMMRERGTVYELTPRGPDLTVRALDLPPIRSIAMNGNALAALGDQLHTRGGRDETFDVPADAVAVTRDAGGWAIAVGGEAPHLLRSNGTRVPLPHPPLDLQRSWTTRRELFVPLDGPAFVAGFRPLEVLPAPGRVLASGDVTGDDCTDILVAGDPLLLQVGDCSTEAPPPSEPISSEPVPTPLGETWTVAEARIGVPLTLALADGVGSDNRFRLVSGPEGMTLRSDGVLVFRPTAGQVGLWRASIQVGDRFTGLVVKVVDPQAGSLVEVPPPTREEPDPRYRNNARRTESNQLGFFGFRECMVGAGAAGGVSRNSRGSWSNVGLPDAIPSGSPAILMSCTGGSERVRWVFGVDSAPVFFYIGPSRRMNHILAGTFGIELHTPTFRIGPIVNAGLLTFGFGLRAQVTPFTTRKGSRHGLEVRAVTFPITPSIQGIVSYNVAFGNF